ncbi:MAG: secretin N-terminal domain-containing protein [candidate division Zixibacteria bacterium]|nr:secretin N-terminal domain-containing protein [candidate division Zixibacteria bacterium]
MKINKLKFGKIIFLVTFWLFIFFALQVLGEQEKILKTLTLQNADVHSVLSFLSEEGKKNIVASPAVTGSITLNLKGVTWRQALEIIAKTYNFALVENPDYIRVLPLQDYLAELTITQKHEADQKTITSLTTEIISVKNGTASELIKPLKASLSDRGTIDVDQRTNSLIVKDIPGNLAQLKELVKALDKETNQIKISAQLLEVETGTLSELGIDWKVVPSLKGNNIMTVEQKANILAPEDKIGNFTYSTIQTDFNLGATISAMVKSNKAKIVAHPEITTVDNKEAFIQMGQKVPIKQFDASGNTVITFVQVGTILRVIPHITSEGRILMKLSPERSSYQFDPNGVIINTNNAETNVVVDDGQTAVIGGLTTQEEKKLQKGIPILKNIPLLGYFFSYTKKEITNHDLVIFVTPTIVTNEMKGLKSSLDTGSGTNTQ